MKKDEHIKRTYRIDLKELRVKLSIEGSAIASVENDGNKGIIVITTSESKGQMTL